MYCKSPVGLPKTDRACTVERENLMICDVHNANVVKDASAILIGFDLIACKAVRRMAFLSDIFDGNSRFATFFDSNDTTMRKTLILRMLFRHARIFVSQEVKTTNAKRMSASKTHALAAA